MHFGFPLNVIIKKAINKSLNLNFVNFFKFNTKIKQNYVLELSSILLWIPGLQGLQKFNPRSMAMGFYQCNIQVCIFSRFKTISKTLQGRGNPAYQWNTAKYLHDSMMTSSKAFVFSRLSSFLACSNIWNRSFQYLTSKLYIYLAS